MIRTVRSTLGRVEVALPNDFLVEQLIDHVIKDRNYFKGGNYVICDSTGRHMQEDEKLGEEIEFTFMELGGQV